MVGSQIDNSTPGPSFGHNLCFKCPNEQCEPILDIYASRAFRWYKERHKTLSLTPAIALWSFGSPPGVHLPKWELLLECECSFLHIPSHFFTLPGVCDVTPRDPLGPHPCNAFALIPGLLLSSHPCKPFALVMSPRLGLRQIWIWQKKYGRKINNASSLQKQNWKQISTKHLWHKITKQQHINRI
jgi:hypothetical protein